LPWIRTTCIVTTILIFSSGLGVGQEQDTTVSDTLSKEKVELMIGDIAPSWALMIRPGEFEFLKNWTVEKGERLRKWKTQPYRHAVVLSFFATWCKPCMKELPHLQNLY
jgi:thiol-disulfide isomerase/thioredoxin